MNALCVERCNMCRPLLRWHGARAPLILPTNPPAPPRRAPGLTTLILSQRLPVAAPSMLHDVSSSMAPQVGLPPTYSATYCLPAVHSRPWGRKGVWAQGCVAGSLAEPQSTATALLACTPACMHAYGGRRQGCGREAAPIPQAPVLVMCWVVRAPCLAPTFTDHVERAHALAPVVHKAAHENIAIAEQQHARPLAPVPAPAPHIHLHIAPNQGLLLGYAG